MHRVADQEHVEGIRDELARDSRFWPRGSVAVDWCPVRTLPSGGTRVVALGVLAGLSYLSWPLGYFLTPSVVGVGLASDLEVSG